MNPMSYEKAKAYGVFFGTLSNENRLGILNVLRKDKLNVSEICEKTKLSQTLVSHNLKRLLHCGFVKKEIEGKYRYYTLNKNTISPLLEIIDKHMKEYCIKIVRGKR